MGFANFPVSFAIYVVARFNYKLLQLIWLHHYTNDMTAAENYIYNYLPMDKIFCLHRGDLHLTWYYLLFSWTEKVNFLIYMDCALVHSSYVVFDVLHDMLGWPLKSGTATKESFNIKDSTFQQGLWCSNTIAILLLL